jgi:hypothetical protein
MTALKIARQARGHAGKRGAAPHHRSVARSRDDGANGCGTFHKRG